MLMMLFYWHHLFKLCNQWLYICASELEFLDMAINVGKSACMRFRPRFKNACVDIVVSGHSVKWEMSARYLGVYLESSTKFKCSFSKKTKRDFFQSFNSIFGKIGRSTPEEVLFELIKSKCLLILLYGTDVCPMNSTDRHSLQFTINKIVYKIFG